MDKELRKRLEEAAEKIYLADNYKADETICLNVGAITKRLQKCYIAGAELGYKEATQRAKEWLIEHAKWYYHFNAKDLLSNFEKYMNKPWEGEK